MDNEELANAIQNGVKIDEANKEAFSNMISNFADGQKSDFTIADVQLRQCWGPWKKRGKEGNQGGFDVAYQMATAGFGSVTIVLKNDGTIYCDNEGMSRKFVKEVLCKLVDKMKFQSEKDGDYSKNH